ncbi:hypothetical protein B0J12DRAFT_748844 [Macrophomina phaseolina]|uniref:C2H2-type domain-containing protein n=1 Tax=Macrophomina phaseolina TaxID=35725 RepID=A0ABQ8GUK4_9PEZI|nr:hypothetical protein B0J12DRAFT_748844 [Macrophomina phaseolina]
MLMEPFNSPLQNGEYRADFPSVSRLDYFEPRGQPRSAVIQHHLLAAHPRDFGRHQPAEFTVPQLSNKGLDQFGCHELDFSFLDEVEPRTPPVRPAGFESLSLPSASTTPSLLSPAQLQLSWRPPGPSDSLAVDAASSAFSIPPHNAIFIDERAADLCQRWLIHFSPCWPEEKDFEAFERLTGESVTRIKLWFGQRLSQPLNTTAVTTHSEPQTNHGRLALPSPPVSSASISRTSSSQGTAVANTTTTTTTTTIIPSTNPQSLTANPPAPFRPHPRRCIPTTDRAALARDPTRPFQCTRACGRSFPRKGEWAKHELKNHPQRVWLCLHGAVAGTPPASTTMPNMPAQRPECAFCLPHYSSAPTPAHLMTTHWHLNSSSTTTNTSHTNAGDHRSWCARQFNRKDHLAVHLRTVHDEEAGVVAWYADAGRLDVGRELEGWERWCGFCRREGCWRGWRERLEHLGRHFARERREMGMWREGEGGRGDEG